jgi:hypothetical protein
MTGIPTTVTRIDVVDQNGVHEFWADRWDIHIQDGGQTVKFIQKDGYGAPAKARRDVALACEIAPPQDGLPRVYTGTVVPLQQVRADAGGRR